jgi:hypothetical protein
MRWKNGEKGCRERKDREGKGRDSKILNTLLSKI